MQRERGKRKIKHLTNEIKEEEERKCNSKINRRRNKQIRAIKRKSTSKTEKERGTEINLTLPSQYV